MNIFVLQKNKIFEKMLFIVFIVIYVVFLSLSTNTLHAQEAEFIPVSPIPNVTDGGLPTIGEYVNNIFVFVLGIAAILAIIQITVGGIQYMTSGVASSMEDAKGRIRSAILGLLLILSTFIILNLINPEILNINLGTGTSDSPIGG